MKRTASSSALVAASSAFLTFELLVVDVDPGGVGPTTTTSAAVPVGRGVDGGFSGVRSEAEWASDEWAE